MSEAITPPQVHQAMVSVCDTIEEQKEYLSELDGAIGDGDHGVNMAKCFRLVKEKLGETPDDEFETILKNVGMVVLNSVGGAMGALYGTFFMRLSQALANFEQAAKAGMESTTDLVAKLGRSSRLGERTRGHQDAGATSCYLILQAMAAAFNK